MAIKQFGNLYGSLVTVEKPTSAVLMIGGGGTLDCEVMKPWQEFLSQHGVTTLSYDFAGIQHSPALETPDSLKSRLVQTLQAYDFLAQKAPDVPVNVVGRSMGGPIALRLPKERAVQNIVLVNPAAYSDKAWQVDFGPDFTVVLRSGDWQDSPDFELAQHLGQKLFVCYGDQEHIIPEPIMQRYLEIGQKREGGILFQGVGHNKFLWPVNDAERAAQERLFDATKGLL